MKITVRFLEPFRLSEWISSGERDIERNRTFKRGLAFARWHKCKADDKGRPFITGSLLRAAVIRAAENLLVLSNGKIKIVSPDGKTEEETCCPGRFFTKEKKNRNGKSMPFRRRSTLKWATDKAVCDINSKSLCPLCQLLGKKNVEENDKDKDKKSRDNGKNVYVNFKNLNLPDKDSHLYDSPEDFASSRIVNRVDYSTGKAHDYFSIFETEHLLFPVFFGEITIADNVSPYAGQLLKDSLRFADRLCGALCVISFETPQEIAIPSRPEDMTSLIQEKADAIIKIFKEAKESDGLEKDKSERLQLMAAAIRELGRDKAKVSALPLNHEKKEAHYLWDIGKDKNNKGIGVRDILKKAANDEQIAGQWRRFCLELGELLYQQAKETRGGLTSAPRILGDAEYVSSADTETEPPVISKGISCETLIVGKLIAKTPFFFGIANKEKTQTDMMVVSDSQNHYRIPRSALRGILRRDLRTVFGTGCNAEIAGEHLCLCPVCLIMKDIVIMDTRSRTDTQPEVRQRIRINPYTGTVQEKALFNMEVGPEGAEFPFILSYKGKSVPKALKNVLKWWSEGKAFLGGAEATGKSVFNLDKIQAFSFDFMDEKVREKYLSTCGWRGFLNGFELDAEDLKGNGWQEQKEILNLPEKDYKPFLWQKVPITIKLASPFLNGDPIRALTEGEGSDIVSFMKYTEGGKRRIFAYKAESFRGVVRSALGRRLKAKDENGCDVPIITLPHQDCLCLLCRLFGSEHETGKLRFEDLKFESDPEEKIFDHVAIDRFTGGAVDKKKFDDCSLVSNADYLTLTGVFWFRNDLTETEAKELGNALKDIRDGFYPLGAKSGTGYGALSGLIITDSEDEIIKKIAEPLKKVSVFEKGSFEKPDSDVNLSLSDNAVYYPYYFLKPDESQVKREPIPVGHEEAFRENLFSGKITCRLTSKTPLIIPDTENEDAFGFKAKAEEEAKERNKGKETQDNEKKETEFHKSYHFMTLNNKPVIPGSEIRGMVSSVYEAVTNSCFRIFDEKYRLSWRMDADRDVLDQFKPGRVTDDGLKIERMKEYRYPFYDQSCSDKDSQEAYFDKWKKHVILTSNSLIEIQNRGNFTQNSVDALNKLKGKKYKSREGLIEDFKNKGGDTTEKNKNQKSIVGLIFEHAEGVKDVPRYKHPTDTDRMMLSLVGYNRDNQSEQKKEYKIIKPSSVLKEGAYFMFAATPSENPEICLPACVIQENQSVKGYLKISGPNKVDKYNIEEPNVGGVPVKNKNNQIIHNRVYLREIFVANAKKKKERDRLVGEFICYDSDKKVTYSMTKRCERIFVKDGGEMFPIEHQAFDLFEILIKEYRTNAKQQETPPVFQTILPDNGKLNPGDLVYFREEKSEGEFKAVEIVPVRISRKIDDVVIGNRKRMRQDLRPCHGEWIGDKDLSRLDNYPEKKLFTRNPEGLCPACRLFGTGAYKSRVRFGFATLENEPRWLKKSENQKERGVTLPLLERPRPTWAIQHNDNENDKVPGRKFYVHHHGWQTVMNRKHPVTRDEIKPDVNNRTVEPLDEENSFTFDIYFENIEPHELGLLLWSLQLEKGLAHKLGMAKSMGFGSVEIDIENISLRKQSGDWEAKERNQAEQWIEKGKKKVAEEREWKDLPHIRDLKQLLCFHDNRNISVGYPVLEKKEDLPGYKELKQTLKDKNGNLKRKKLLTVPWTPYHHI